MSSKLRVQELRDELSKRGLDTTGLKPALVARLDEEIASETQTDDAATKDEEAPSETDKNDEKGNGKKKTHPRDGETIDRSVKRIKLEDINKLSVDELKSALTALDCSVAGSKAILKKRLKSALQDADQSDGEKSENAEKKLVTATKKGRAVLDPNLPDHIKRDYHVFEEGDDVYDAMLNQTNIGGNNNKYYVIQALENDAGTSFQLFTRWGRVGAKGQSKLFLSYGKDKLKHEFVGTFYSKTNNDWYNRHTFTSYPGKYTWLEMDYDAEEEKEQAEDSAKPKTKVPSAPLPSKLRPEVQKLISTICNMSMMKQEMAEIGYDARKLPLGKLSKSTVLKGYEVLKRIAASLEKGIVHSELEQLSGEFYTVIPHDFGFKKMRDFVIDTPQIVKKKLEMVEALGEIEVATKILAIEKEEEEDPLFSQYQKLKCGIEPVLNDSDEADWIKAYVANTHGKTHSYYSLKVEHIFKVVREGEDSRFQPFAGTKNRMLLWHGSRMCNWIGILSQGLRIAPPEAPVSGYMFGKGVYFADIVSKSANYCCPGGDNLGLLLLCEVALGDMAELLSANYHAGKLPPGKLSTKGIGYVAPNPKGFKVLPDGVTVPMGKPHREHSKGGSLQYNEYIVYDTNQIRMQYLLMVKFGTTRVLMNHQLQRPANVKVGKKSR